MSDHDDGLELDLGSIESQEDESLQGEETESQEEETTESDTESESEGDTSGYVETNDPKVKARLGQLTREKWENARAKDKAERELAELRKELATFKAPKPVEAPNSDLAIDDPAEFTKRQSEYATYIKQQALHDQEQEKTTKSIEASQQAQLEERLTGYNKRAAELKISKEVLARAGDIVGNSGISKEVAEFLLEHENGPAIVKSLADKPDELYQIATLPAAKAAAMIERMYPAKRTLKSEPPPPPTKINGSRSSGSKAADGTLYE